MAPGRADKTGIVPAALPEGVSTADWALERVRTQNPCIRTVLECLHLLERLDSFNYFILHCSPDQLVRLRGRVEQILVLFEREGLPRLREGSCIPELGEARSAAVAAYETLWRNSPEELGDGSGPGVGTGSTARKALSRTIGQLQGVLEDAFGRLMAADPRSHHAADYFLSRQFARHVTETETLYGLVYDLEAFLRGQGTVGTRAMSTLATALIRGGTPPAQAAWAAVVHFLRLVREELLPRLEALVVMQGIRFSEARVLDELGLGLRVLGEVILEQQTNLTEIAVRAEREAVSGAEAMGSRLILSQRLGSNLLELETQYRALREFVPTWLQNLETRRALMLLPPS
jgi:hypothetical protein